MTIMNVMYDFQGDPAQSTVTVNSGQVVEFVQDYGDGWTEVAFTDGSGLRGAVPSTYLSEASAAPAPPPPQHHGQEAQYQQPQYQQSQQFQQPQQYQQQPPPPAAVADQALEAEFAKYRKMLKAGLPEGAVMQAAQRDNVTLPSDFFSGGGGNSGPGAPAQSGPMGGGSQADPQYAKYAKMLKAGLPEGAVAQAAQRDGVSLPGDFFSGGGGNAGGAPPAMPQAQQDQPSGPPAGGNPLLAGIQGFDKSKLHASETSAPPPPSQQQDAGGAVGGNPLLAGIQGFNKNKLKKSAPKPKPQEAPKPAAPANDMMSMIQAKALARKQRQGAEDTTEHAPAHGADGESQEPEWMRKQREMKAAHESGAPPSQPKPMASQPVPHSQSFAAQRAAPALHNAGENTTAAAATVSTSNTLCTDATSARTSGADTSGADTSRAVTSRAVTSRAVTSRSVTSRTKSKSTGTHFTKCPSAATSSSPSASAAFCGASSSAFANGIKHGTHSATQNCAT
ncbi:Sorting nexin-9 [Hondaea fermentalgiana]|uniref:Sorting nexin-9 n=1 Tax=Hondaea fermentalgiana TaxID=2315210 RepID=A0A2R5GGC1_9STRA|nr:Sorting nexin-9 [Hondaea fermentalgiana]|eukprot:GBG29956.1 Sorting nexin-9 [Hondaea fermentalgiana]